MKHQALFWEITANGAIQCRLCPNNCLIQNKQSGICRKRTNQDGVLYAETYGNLIGLHNDPIEKKPLFHFYPGSHIFSCGPNSCNLSCSFCQNYQISQIDCKTTSFTPEMLLAHCLENNYKYVAFTYSEPIMMFEYILDVAKLFKQHNIKIVMVSNGFINQEPLEMLAPWIDAWNIDLKSFSDEFYKKYCGGKLDPVLNTIRYLSDKTHLEIAYLVVTNLNDSESDLLSICEFLKEINPEIPLHINRYFPNYQISKTPTSINLLNDFQAIASKYLNYVYIGNVYLNYPDTLCPKCQGLLIDRSNQITYLEKDRCPKCNKEIYGKFQ